MVPWQCNKKRCPRFLVQNFVLYRVAPLHECSGTRTLDNFGTKKDSNKDSNTEKGLAFLGQIRFGSVPRFRSSLPTPRSVGGDSCAVKWIDFRGRRDLGGALHPEIGKLTTLQYLDLDDTNVSGSLDVLANNTKLAILRLRHTRVTGRLEDLSKAESLQHLDLTGTEVTGKLKSLAKLKWLRELDLANLKVGGDAAVMAEWSKIKHVDLSGTEVEFVKTDFLQQFEAVKEGPSWSLIWKCPLPPALRFLDVSRTPQFSLAQDLLRPFAGCGKLATLKAAGCGLTGPLWPEILYSDGDTVSMDRWPLSQALSVLDLARNNVTDVAELPGSCRKLVLTGNPHVSFGAGVVEKAIKDIVFIDLRNATFGNLSDSLLLIGQLAVITHVPLSIVVAAVTSFAERINRTHWSDFFQIRSETI